MEHALIVASRGAQLLQELLQGQESPGGRAENILAAASGSQARRVLLERPCDLVVINAPLTDENGSELAVEIAGDSQAGVILLVAAEHADAVAARVEEYGVFVVEKPINKVFFYRALKLVYASMRRLRGVESEKLKLQGKIEEIRLVDRAKCALIQYLNLTEPQAHRYIEKQAMDMRASRRQVAEGILKTYEA